MKLIILYGPPAAGKYTIAKLLADKTGYKFFHNHVTVDLLKPLFTFGTPGFFKLSDKIRLEIFEEAARQKIPGMVFTLVYKKGRGDEFVKAIIENVSKNGGEVKFIQIYCSKEKLYERVKEQQRVEMKKLSSPTDLEKLFSEGDFQSPISFVESSRIDNTDLTIEETLQKILEVI